MVWFTAPGYGSLMDYEGNKGTLEIKEAIQLLKGEGPADMKELVLKLGMEIVRLAGVAGSTLSAKQTVQRHLTDGSALEKFKDLVRAQGGAVRGRRPLLVGRAPADDRPAGRMR